MRGVTQQSEYTQGLMCAAFGKEIGLDQSNVSGVPEMVGHLQTQFACSGRMTLLPPELAARLRLPVWRRFEASAHASLQLAGRLTNACIDQVRRRPDDCIVASLQQQNVSRYDIQRIITDLFIAASDTVPVFILTHFLTLLTSDILTACLPGS